MRLYEEIVGRGGVSPTHFFYDMTFGEAAAFMRGLDLREKADWERTRKVMWAVVQSQSTKRIGLKDVQRFPWDDDYVEPSEVTEEALDRVREIAKRFER